MKKYETSRKSSNAETRAMYTGVLYKSWIRNFFISIFYPVKILPLYCRQYCHRIPYWYLLPGSISLVLLLIAIFRSWNPLPHGHGIPYLSTYTTPLRCPTGHLRGHKVVTLLGPWSGHPHPQLTLIPTKYP